VTPRLLFVSHTAEWTGPTNSLLHLLRYFSSRFEVGVLCPGHGLFSEALQREGIATISLPSLRRRRIPDIYRLVTSGGYDLVYGNNAGSACRNAMIAAKLARVPFACHVRGMGGRRKWRTLGFLRLADAVIAVSEACARAISPYSGRRRLFVVHNGVDLAVFATDRHTRDADRLALGLEADTTLVVSVSHLCPRKGQGYAVEAMARIVRQVPSAHLLLVGALDRNPRYVDEVRHGILKLNVEAHVSILGFRNDVPQLLRAADVFLHTAVSDPHPRAVIEAMGVGLPVVAFGVDGVKETVTPGTTGYLIPPGNVNELAGAVAKLLQDAQLRKQLGTEGRGRAADSFSADATAERVGEIIELTLRRSSPLARGRKREALIA